MTYGQYTNRVDGKPICICKSHIRWFYVDRYSKTYTRVPICLQVQILYKLLNMQIYIGRCVAVEVLSSWLSERISEVQYGRQAGQSYKKDSRDSTTNSEDTIKRECDILLPAMTLAGFAGLPRDLTSSSPEKPLYVYWPFVGSWLAWGFPAPSTPTQLFASFLLGW